MKQKKVLLILPFLLEPVKTGRTERKERILVEHTVLTNLNSFSSFSAGLIDVNRTASPCSSERKKRSQKSVSCDTFRDTYHPALVAEREEEGADEKREKDEPNDESQNDFAAHERP